MPGTRATQEGPFWKKVLRDRLVGKKIVVNVLVLLRRRRLRSQETKRQQWDWTKRNAAGERRLRTEENLFQEKQKNENFCLSFVYRW